MAVSRWFQIARDTSVACAIVPFVVPYHGGARSLPSLGEAPSIAYRVPVLQEAANKRSHTNGMSYRLCVWASLALGVALPTVSTAWEYAGSSRLLTTEVLANRETDLPGGSFQQGFLWSSPSTLTPLNGLEFRFGSQVVHPAEIDPDAAESNGLAGAVNVGLHGLWEFGRGDLSTGVDLTGVGPSEDLNDLLEELHAADQSATGAVIAEHIDSTLYPSVELAIGQSVPLPGMHVYPFAETRMGAEDYARVGIDAYWGPAWQGGTASRDRFTGFAMPNSRASEIGSGVSLGFDAALSSETSQLGDDEQYTLDVPGFRVRAGYLLQGPRTQLFYGTTWMGKELTSDTDGQVVGSFNLSFRF